MEQTDGVTRLFIGNLPWTTEEAELAELFNSVSPCLKVTIPRGRQGRSRGFALGEYASPLDAMQAIQALEGARALYSPAEGDRSRELARRRRLQVADFGSSMALFYNVLAWLQCWPGHVRLPPAATEPDGGESPAGV